MNPETARYFIDHEDAGQGLMLVIEVDSPVKALMSNDPHEMEFLLAPEIEFEVISKKQVRSKNITIVHLKTTGAP